MKNEELQNLIELLQQQLLLSNENYKNLLDEFKDIKTKYLPTSNCPELRRTWLPREEVMNFMKYGTTRMLYVTNKYNLVTSEIGTRKFYSTQSLLNALSENIISPLNNLEDTNGKSN